MVFQFKYPNLLPKSKEERTEVISRLLFTFVAHKLQKHLNSSNTFSYLFKKYSITFNHILKVCKTLLKNQHVLLDLF